MPVTSALQGGVVLVVAASTAFGAVPVLSRLAYDHGAGTLTLLAGRFGLAAAALALVLVAAPRFGVRRGAVRGRPLLVAGTATTLANIGYLGAVALDDVTRVAPIVFLFPVLVPLAAAAVGQEPLRWPTAAAAAVGVTGSVLVIGSDLELPQEPAAAALALLGAGANVVFYIAVSRALRGADWLPAAAVTFAVPAVSLTVGAVLTGSGTPDGRGWVLIAVVGLLCTAVPYGVWLAGLRRVGESRAAAISVWEPAVAVLMALVVLGEQLAPLQAIGIGLVLGSLLAVAAAARRERLGAPG
jgi:drug/metabolite transporter (DMT)-like permease